jgi:YVTN family beta-propeller protein
LLITLIAVSVAGGAAGEEVYHSPLALAACGDRIYVADHTANQVAVFDTAGNVLEGTIAVPGPPTGLVLAPDATLLYVTTWGPEGQVCVIRLSDRTIVATWPAGHTPVAPAVTPDGKTLFVCNPYNNSVAVLDLALGATVQTISVGHEPSAAVMTPDGARLFVANLLPASRADGDYVSATVDVIDVAGRALLGSVKLPNGSSSLLGIALSPDGLFAYVTHILSRYQLPTTQLERGWINTNAVTIIDVARMEPVNTILLDDVDLGAANPWGVTCTADGKWLCVAHSGTHELSVIDRTRLHEKLVASAAAGEAGDVPNDLAYILELRRRVRLEGKGPRGMAALGSRVLAAEYFSGTLASVDLAVEGAVFFAWRPARSVPPSCGRALFPRWHRLLSAMAELRQLPSRRWARGRAQLGSAERRHGQSEEYQESAALLRNTAHDGGGRAGRCHDIDTFWHTLYPF